MDLQQFDSELQGIAADALRERGEAPYRYLGLDDLTRAFRALHQHAKEEGDLFIDTEAPTDEALLLIFAFLVLP